MCHEPKRRRAQAQNQSLMVGEKHVFHLYISGATSKSVEAITNLKTVLQDLFKRNYELRVTDIYQEPQTAARAQVRVAPTLVRERPTPELRLAGDFSSENKIRSLLIAWISKRDHGG